MLVRHRLSPEQVGMMDVVLWIICLRTEMNGRYSPARQGNAQLLDENWKKNMIEEKEIHNKLIAYYSSTMEELACTVKRKTQNT